MTTIKAPNTLQTLFLVARRFLLGAPKFRYVGAGYDVQDGYVLDAIPTSMIPPPQPRYRPRRQQQQQQQEPFQLQQAQIAVQLQDQLSKQTTTLGVAPSLLPTPTTTSATALAAVSTALISSNTSNVSMIPEVVHDPFPEEDAQSVLFTYTLETIDPDRSPPVPYWYDSPHFRPDV